MSRILPNPAIYKIQNTVTGEIYVGGTQNAQNRWRGHKSDFRLNRARNPKMQQDYNNSEDKNKLFEFTVLEYMEYGISDDAVVRREQEWMNFIQPTYNSRNAISLFGSAVFLERERKLAGNRKAQSEEEKLKRATSVKEYWKLHTKVISEEQRRLTSLKLSGDGHPNYGKTTPNHVKQAISDALSNRIEYTFLMPDNKEYRCTRLNDITEKFGINISSLRAIVGGRYNQCGGWKFVEKHKVR